MPLAETHKKLAPSAVVAIEDWIEINRKKQVAGFTSLRFTSFIGVWCNGSIRGPNPPGKGSSPLTPVINLNPSDMTVATRYGKMAVILRLNLVKRYTQIRMK